MASTLERFFRPASIAVFGGVWAENVIQQLQKSGFAGSIWPVHPGRKSIAGIPCYANLADLPSAPDAAFIGVNREQTINLVAELNQMGAGGAVCFASGFREKAAASLPSTDDLQAQLKTVAGEMPVLGPNCYGYVNYLDNVCLWPDQHGGKPVAEGAAILLQSSNIAINLSMQKRGLSISHLITLGNQSVLGWSDLIEYLIMDQRVKAIGLYLEGFDDLQKFERAARAAWQKNIPLVALKIGKSEQAQQATLTHTASLAGGAAATSAFLKRLGIIEVDSLPVFLETLKLLSTVDSLPDKQIMSISCSGGEASLMADLCLQTGLSFPPLTPGQAHALNAALGDKVDLANPLDYHTYIWGDVPTMTACFSAAFAGQQSLTLCVLDIPRADVCDPKGHLCAVESIIAAAKTTDKPVCVVSCLPENIEPVWLEKFHQAGVVCLLGMAEALAAVNAAAIRGELNVEQQPIAISSANHSDDARVLDEYEAKQCLAQAGVAIPDGRRFTDRDAINRAAQTLAYPLVLKGLGLAHKTEHNAVHINIKNSTELGHALKACPDCPAYLLESMVDDKLVELIVGVSCDATGLMLLTIGAGGVLTEILQDSSSLILPCSEQAIEEALNSLTCAPLLYGYRGKADANMMVLKKQIANIADFAVNNKHNLQELDVNPLIVGQKAVIAVDVLLKTNDTGDLCQQ